VNLLHYRSVQAIEQLQLSFRWALNWVAPSWCQLAFMAL